LPLRATQAFIAKNERWRMFIADSDLKVAKNEQWLHLVEAFELNEP
jgi:hypothetical protein